MVLNELNVLLDDIRGVVFGVGLFLPFDFREIGLVPDEEVLVFEVDGVLFLSTHFVEAVHIQLM